MLRQVGADLDPAQTHVSTGGQPLYLRVAMLAAELARSTAPPHVQVAAEAAAGGGRQAGSRARRGTGSSCSSRCVVPEILTGDLAVALTLDPDAPEAPVGPRGAWPRHVGAATDGAHLRALFPVVAPSSWRPSVSRTRRRPRWSRRRPLGGTSSRLPGRGRPARGDGRRPVDRLGRGVPLPGPRSSRSAIRESRRPAGGPGRGGCAPWPCSPARSPPLRRRPRRTGRGDRALPRSARRAAGRARAPRPERARGARVLQATSRCARQDRPSALYPARRAGRMLNEGSGSPNVAPWRRTCRGCGPRSHGRCSAAAPRTVAILEDLGDSPAGRSLAARARPRRARQHARGAPGPGRRRASLARRVHPRHPARTSTTWRARPGAHRAVRRPRRSGPPGRHAPFPLDARVTAAVRAGPGVGRPPDVRAGAGCRRLRRQVRAEGSGSPSGTPTRLGYAAGLLDLARGRAKAVNGRAPAQKSTLSRAAALTCS